MRDLEAQLKRFILKLRVRGVEARVRKNRAPYTVVHPWMEDATSREASGRLFLRRLTKPEVFTSSLSST